MQPLEQMEEAFKVAEVQNLNMSVSIFRNNKKNNN